MPEKSISIIGSGLAGLSAGCYAQMNGFQSRIFEHHTAPGGVAAAWKRQSYLIDGGIHFIMGHKPGTELNRLFTELGVSDPSLYLNMTAYGRFIHKASGVDISIGSDLDCLASQLKERAPADGRVIDEIIGRAKRFQGRDLSTVGMNKPPELTSLFDQARDIWDMRALVPYFSGRYNRTVGSFVKDLKTGWLKDFFCSLFLPESPVWFVMLVLALVADRQCAYLAGGCSDFVRDIEKRYKSLGGEAIYGATVEKVLVENDRAAGVRLADGREYRSDYVVSASDSYAAIFRLLEGKYASKKIVERHETWPVSRPFLTASFGVRREFKGEQPFTSVILEEPITIGNESVKSLFFRILNYSSRFAPAGATLFQVEIETGFGYWFDLQNGDRAAYEREKGRVASELAAQADKYYPGFLTRVELVDVATPYTTWRYTLNRQGAWGGWLMTPKTITQRIERSLPGLKGFYMAGQWVMSGGVAPSLYSGRHAIQLVCRDEGRKFKSPG